MFKEFMSKVKVEDLTPKRSIIKEYLYSLWFALLKIGYYLTCFIWWFIVLALLTDLGCSMRDALFLIFLGVLGSTQFDHDIIKKVEKKMGYKILNYIK